MIWQNFFLLIGARHPNSVGTRHKEHTFQRSLSASAGNLRSPGTEEDPIVANLLTGAHDEG